MKTKPLLLALMIIMVMLNSCSRHKEIGFLMDNFIQERWTKDRDLFIDRVKELGDKVNLAVAEGDGPKQIMQARQMLEQKVDVLVIVPVDQYAAANIVKLAHDFKVKIISYDRMIRNCNLDLYISFDNVEVGRLQADYLTRACPKGEYALIGGATSDNNSALIRLGQMNVLQPLVEKGDIRVVYDQFVNKWTQEEGYRCMKECLAKNGGRIDAVLAANDDLAAGALRAIDEKKLGGKVFLAGQDADLGACQRIVMGTQTMTVYKPIEAIARKAAEAAMQMARGATFDNLNLSVNNGKMMVPSILLPPMAVNQQTIRLTVIADGYLEENNIYKKK